MPRLTCAEYDALDEEITKNPPDVDPDGARRPVRMVVVDDISADWLRSKAAAEHTTEGAIVGALIRKESVTQSA